MATPTPATNTPSKQLPIFSSPAPRSVPHTGNTNMLSYDSPAVLNMLTEASSGMGGVGMGITMSGLGMSGLGMTASALGRADEAERSRRLQSILAVVGAKPGRVSESGLLALCKKLGVQVDKNSAEPHSWMLLLGDEAVCDIVFRNDEIASVNLQTNLDSEQEDLQFGPNGSQILVRSLKPLPGQSKINVTLERFSANLDKLLTLDKLSNPQNGGVSCYNAIAGVYTSLRKLFEHEKKMALAVMEVTASNSSYAAEREVLCKKSGRPRLNGASCLGLSLEYWMDRRHLVPKNKKRKQNVDAQQPDAYLENDDAETNKLYSLTIECEASPSTLYTPIRISQHWISDEIEKPTDANDADASLDNIVLDRPSLDWQDPKPTYLEPAEPSNDEALDISSAPGRLPNIRFIARFNPPLVVPLDVCLRLYQTVGIEPRQEDIRPTTFAGAVLRPGEIDPYMLNSADLTHEITSTRTTMVHTSSGGQTEQRHNLSLYLPKLEWSLTLESLPFSHPKQLVGILPILRQYAFTTSLLQDSFLDKVPMTAQAIVLNPLSPPLTPPEEDRAEALQIDMNLTYTPPAPRLTFFVPHPLSKSSFSNSHSQRTTNGSKTSYDQSAIMDLVSNLHSSNETDAANTSHPPIQITIDVHPNATITITEQNILPTPPLQAAKQDGEQDANTEMEKAEEQERRVKRLANALDVTGDIGVWAGWLRREVERMGSQSAWAS